MLSQCSKPTPISLYQISLPCPHNRYSDYLAHEANVNAADFDRNTPLHLAVSKEGSAANIRVIELLLESGAYVNDKTERGNTPLHFAVDTHAANEVFGELFEYGGGWNGSNGEPRLDTPLKKMADRTGDT